MPFDNMGGRFTPVPGIGMQDPRFYPVSTIAAGVIAPLNRLKGSDMTFVLYTKANSTEFKPYTKAVDFRII